MLPLKKTERLGKLELYEIFDDFDGPKFFSVRNDLNEYYLVYWSGDYKHLNATKWLFLRVSETRLSKIRNLSISVNEAYLKPERDLLCVTQSFDGSISSIVEATQENANFPPQDFYFDPDEIESIHPESEWIFELGIHKKSTSPDTILVTRVIDSITSIIEDLIELSGRSESKLYPLTAKYGSFKVRLGSNHAVETEDAIRKLVCLLDSPNSDNDYYQQFRIDPYKMQELFDLIETSKVEVRLNTKNPEVINETVKINAQNTIRVRSAINATDAVFVGSIKVPQANDLDRVLDIVCKKASGASISHDDVEGISSERQVRYHTDAAYTLGLMERNTAITSAGLFLASLEYPDQRYRFIADRFESSDVGWAWMKWAGVNSLKDINPHSAKDFILNCVKGLNDETAGRRSSTLSRWLEVLAPHCRDYRQSMNSNEVHNVDEID